MNYQFIKAIKGHYTKIRSPRYMKTYFKDGIYTDMWFNEDDMPVNGPDGWSEREYLENGIIVRVYCLPGNK